MLTEMCVESGEIRAASITVLGSAELLTPRYVPKPWGRRTSSHGMSDDAWPLGEIVHEAPDLGLTIKWLQTSEPLSVQVHPQGKDGKDEWWYVVEAQAGAYIDIGLKAPATRSKLFEAAHDGSLPSLLNRIAPKPGDTYFIRAGTIHALGPGLIVLEVQEASDVTYRLFDYGRDRELHLNQGLFEARTGGAVECLPSDDSSFTVSQIDIESDARIVMAPERACLVVLSGEGEIDGQSFAANQCWCTHGPITLCAKKRTHLVVVESRVTIENKG
jgi:mannose-6-phosphate isomerase